MDTMRLAIKRGQPAYQSLSVPHILDVKHKRSIDERSGNRKVEGRYVYGNGILTFKPAAG